MKSKKSVSDPIDATEFRMPTAVIRITTFYRPVLENERVALYEVTRAHWSIAKDKRILQTKIALSVHNQRVLEVYEIAHWLPANSTMMAIRMDPGPKSRYEFVGRVARDSIRRKYIGCSIESLIPRGNIRPVLCFGM